MFATKIRIGFTSIRRYSQWNRVGLLKQQCRRLQGEDLPVIETHVNKARGVGRRRTRKR